MSLIRTSAPASATVTKAQMAAHLRITGSQDDDYIIALESAATLWAEQYCHRSFVTQSWELRLHQFPSADTPGDFPSAILIPQGELIALTEITYIDTGGVTQTVSPANYAAGQYADRIRIVPAFSKVWPYARYQPDSVIVKFTAGYGQSSVVPELIKSAIKLLASHWYENREAVIVGVTAGVAPLSVEAILDQFRIR